MRTAKTFILMSLIGGIALFTLAMIAPASYADVSNQATEMTFDQAVRIPGHVLPAGTYWFTVRDSMNGNGQIVQIQNADGTRPIAQLPTQSTDVTGGFGDEVSIHGVTWPSGKLVVTFSEGGNQPPALLDWYYPGDTNGHRFIYSGHEERQLDEETHQTMGISVGGTISVGRNLATFN